MSVVIPAITSLLAEINAVGPHRDKRSDGIRPNAVHLAESSDHNADDTPGVRTPGHDADTIAEHHALDVTTAGPWEPGWSAPRIVSLLVGHPALHNIIFNGRIASSSWGWTWEPYDGTDVHRTHFHVGFRYGSGAGPGNPENFTGPWGITAAYEQEHGVSMQDVAEFFASVDRAVRKDGDSKPDRDNRDAFAHSVRFALGLNFDQQTGDNLPVASEDQVAKLGAQLLDAIAAGAAPPAPVSTPANKGGKVTPRV